MIHPEYFGNPNNPFDEAIPHPEYLLWGSPIRNVTSKQILYMMEFQEQVDQTTDSNGVTTRSVQFEASAPLHEQGVFMNGARTDFDQDTGEATWEAILIDLEDIVSKSNDISERRIVLKRPEGKLFGVAGVEVRKKTIRDLSSLTIRLTSVPEPHAELWVNRGGIDKLLMRATSPFTEGLDFHLVALSRTLGRNLNKLIEPPEDRPKYKYSDFA